MCKSLHLGPPAGERVLEKRANFDTGGLARIVVRVFCSDLCSSVEPIHRHTDILQSCRSSDSFRQIVESLTGPSAVKDLADGSKAIGYRARIKTYHVRQHDGMSLCVRE